MPSSPSPAKERLLVNIGAGSALLGMLALGEVVFASSWTYGLCAAIAALVFFSIFILSLSGSRLRKSGVPTNAQLQQPAPSIVERIDGA